MTGARPYGATVAVLVASMAAAPLLQGAIAVLGPQLTHELGLTRSQFGLLPSVLFAVATATSAFGANQIARLGSVRGIKLLFVLTAIATLLAALAPSFWFLLVAMAIAGVPMALANPSTNQLLHDSVPDRRRGLAAGAKQSGVKVAQVLAGVVVAPLAVWWNWRIALVITALSVLAWVIVPVGGSTRGGTAKKQTHNSGAHTLSAVRWLTLYAGCMGALQSAVGSYLPLFGTESIGLSIPKSGAALSLLGGVGVVTRLLAGLYLERLTAIRSTFAIDAMATGLSILGLLAADHLASPGMFFASAVLFGMTAPVWSVYAIFAMVRWTRGRGLDRLTSTMYTGFYAGFMIGPPTFGFFVDHSGGYTLAWTSLLVCLAVAVLACWRMRPPAPVTTA